MKHFIPHQRLALALFALVFISGCTQMGSTPVTPQIVDVSLIVSQACDSPCWQGLILGRTTRQEALDYIKTNAFIAANPDVGSEGVRWWWTGEQESRDISNRFAFQNNKLVEVYLNPNIDVTLSNFLNAYGLPDKVILMRRHYGNTSGFNMRILYEKVGIEALWEYIANDLPDQGDITFAVCPSTNYPVSNVDYLANDIIQKESQNYIIGRTDHGFVFAGKDLARLNGKTWETYCLNIRDY